MLTGIGHRQHWDAGSHGAFGAVRPFRAQGENPVFRITKKVCAFE